LGSILSTTQRKMKERRKEGIKEVQEDERKGRRKEGRK
jgi:hypothetical protein